MAQYIYKDIDQSLSKNYKTDGDAVFQSVMNVLKTRKGTRMFNKEFGCNVEDIIMEFCDDITSLSVYAEIVEAITKWEPRAVLNLSKTTVTADPDNHIFWLNLWFSISNITGQEFNYEVGLTK